MAGIAFRPAHHVDAGTRMAALAALHQAGAGTQSTSTGFTRNILQKGAAL